ncbi:ABC transporter permease [Streptomyces drozdowiczii]|uniref:ABC transporter permease n=1 Tax=Streptomyces drozdowiczii TaxID=202862 RepID=A0ABY6PNU0_9ACTN|nr:ABC transporter permease [Streptomyces drozdowiczii]MCX0246651.1 ABC transporter permease [Streptomyces drozdowiczii]UZK53872.1 ABC transporter permease [Streptomyces drozdowiczii]
MSAGAVQAAGAARTGVRRSRSWVPPVVVLVLLGALWAYIGTRDLDSVESRSLTSEVVLTALWQHIQLVVASTLLTIVIGVPLGVLLTRPGISRAGAVVLAAANASQAVPSIGVLVILAMVVGVGFWMAVVALVLYALLPVLRNTMVGIRQVSPALIDAGRGMGMSRREILFTIELPLAVPVMLAGIRVALILNVGVATLAAFTNAGGLGSIISSGISLDRTPVLVVGSALTMALALAVDWLAGLAERALRPRGM